nr:MAG TPA: hypothetical protein [Caudoviricetes sp.]
MTFLFYFAFLILSYRRNLRKIFKFGFNCCLSFFCIVCTLCVCYNI